MSLVPPGTSRRNFAGKRMERPIGLRWCVMVELFISGVFAFLLITRIDTYLTSKIDRSINKFGVETNSLAPLHVGVTKSPLHEFLAVEASFDSLSDRERAIITDIENKAALEVKFFAIPETVYEHDKNNLLYSYVEKQLALAKDVLTEKQGAFVLELIESGVAQGCMMKKELGDKGSLKNSIVIAFLKEDAGNLHFAMAATSVEPRLGWRLITKKQRNEWNEALSHVVQTRLKAELSNLFVSQYKGGDEREVDQHIARPVAHEELS